MFTFTVHFHFRTIHHQLSALGCLASLLAMVAAMPTLDSSQSWVCKGQQAQLTYRRCSELGKKGIGHGCFYLEVFAQYRSCQSICANVHLLSADEERCNVYCPGKLISTLCDYETIKAAQNYKT